MCFTFALDSDISKCICASCVKSIFPLRELSIFARIILTLTVVSFDCLGITDLNAGGGGLNYRMLKLQHQTSVQSLTQLTVVLCLKGDLALPRQVPYQTGVLPED